MPSSTTLALLRDRVEAALVDSANAVWATGTIDEAIRLAMHEYNLARPQRAVGTVTLTAASRELALSSLTGLTGVDRVWFPYDSTDPDYPPEFIKWELWENAGAFTLYLDVVEPPAVDDVARVYYRKIHTLNGLDSGGATTFAVEDESVIEYGAIGFSLLSRAIDLNEDTTQNALAVPNYREQANDYLRRFRAYLTGHWPENNTV